MTETCASRSTTWRWFRKGPGDSCQRGTPSRIEYLETTRALPRKESRGDAVSRAPLPDVALRDSEKGENVLSRKEERREIRDSASPLQELFASSVCRTRPKYAVFPNSREREREREREFDLNSRIRIAAPGAHSGATSARQLGEYRLTSAKLAYLSRIDCFVATATQRETQRETAHRRAFDLARHFF